MRAGSGPCPRRPRTCSALSSAILGEQRREPAAALRLPGQQLDRQRQPVERRHDRVEIGIARELGARNAQEQLARLLDRQRLQRATARANRREPAKPCRGSRRRRAARGHRPTAPTPPRPGRSSACQGISRLSRTSTPGRPPAASAPAQPGPGRGSARRSPREWRPRTLARRAPYRAARTSAVRRTGLATSRSCSACRVRCSCRYPPGPRTAIGRRRRRGSPPTSAARPVATAQAALAGKVRRCRRDRRWRQGARAASDAGTAQDRR